MNRSLSFWGRMVSLYLQNRKFLNYFLRNCKKSVKIGMCTMLCTYTRGEHISLKTGVDAQCYLGLVKKSSIRIRFTR